jgi:hypothetical protein
VSRVARRYEFSVVADIFMDLLFIPIFKGVASALR